ncbi:MAG: acyl-CoA dehydrogenase family protein [Rhodospirillales bacterium]
MAGIAKASIASQNEAAASITDIARLSAALDRVAGPIAERAAAVDRSGAFPHENMKTLHEAGLLGVCLPKEQGGLGLGPNGDYEPFFTINDRMGALCGSTAQVLFVQNASVVTLRMMATKQRMQSFADAIHSRGASFCYVGAEPNDRFTKTGQRIMSETIAKRVKGGWNVTGKKAFATGSGGASFIIAYCMPEGEEDQNKMLVVVTPVDAPGVKVIDSWDNMGQRATTSGMIEFDNCFVPDDMVLGEPGAFFEVKILGAIYQLGFAALLTGFAQGALDFTVNFVKNSLRPTVGFENAAHEPNIQVHIADMSTDIEASRALWKRAANMLKESERGNGSMFSAMNAVYNARTFATQISVAVGSRLFQICGARSTAGGLDADRFWRNARTLSLHDNLDRQRGIIGRYVLGIENPAIGTR